MDSSLFSRRILILVIGLVGGHVFGADVPLLPPSPIQQFRAWLSMNAEQRTNAVAEWPAENQRVLLQKLSAYEELPADERERRLKMLELRWYLRPLMGMKPEDRSGSLNLVPPAMAGLVQERLKHWDALDSSTRAEILANDNARELVMRYYLKIQEGRSKEQVLFSLPPKKRAELEAAMKSWGSVPANVRNRTAAQLTAFFQLPLQEQARAFGELSEDERQEMQRTLDAFARLSPEQRRVCVESFQKFTMMPPPERASFLRNAARWQAMTPAERAAWRDLVTKLPPLPPISVEPPRPQAAANKAAVAQTNPPGVR